MCVVAVRGGEKAVRRYDDAPVCLPPSEIPGGGRRWRVPPRTRGLFTPRARPPAPQSNNVCRLDPTIATDVLADLFFLVCAAPPHTCS